MCPDLGPDTVPECIVKVPCSTFPEDLLKTAHTVVWHFGTKDREQYFLVFLRAESSHLKVGQQRECNLPA